MQKRTKLTLGLAGIVVGAGLFFFSSSSTFIHADQTDTAAQTIDMQQNDALSSLLKTFGGVVAAGGTITLALLAF